MSAAGAQHAVNKGLLERRARRVDQRVLSALPAKQRDEFLAAVPAIVEKLQ